MWFVRELRSQSRLNPNTGIVAVRNNQTYAAALAVNPQRASIIDDFYAIIWEAAIKMGNARGVDSPRLDIRWLTQTFFSIGASNEILFHETPFGLALKNENKPFVEMVVNNVHMQKPIRLLLEALNSAGTRKDLGEKSEKLDQEMTYLLKLLAEKHQIDFEELEHLEVSDTYKVIDLAASYSSKGNILHIARHLGLTGFAEEIKKHLSPEQLKRLMQHKDFTARTPNEIAEAKQSQTKQFMVFTPDGLGFFRLDFLKMHMEASGAPKSSPAPEYTRLASTAPPLAGAAAAAVISVGGGALAQGTTAHVSRQGRS